jgi:hypothetical protein
MGGRSWEAFLGSAAIGIHGAGGMGESGGWANANEI